MRYRNLAAAAITLAAACMPNASPTSRAGRATASTASAAAPASQSAPATTRVTDTFATSKGELRVTPIFHASVLLEVADQAIYVDPFSKGDFRGLPKADVVFITHPHGDHMDPKALEIIATPRTRIIAPTSVARAPEMKGQANVSIIENGQKQSLGLFDIEAVPAYNLERGPAPNQRYHEKGVGNGYVLTFGDKRFYFSGDTECTPEMKALPTIDVAFVCMNLPYTMPPKEAAQCVDAFRPKVLFPYHFGSPTGGPASNLGDLTSALDPGVVEVRIRKWY